MAAIKQTRTFSEWLSGLRDQRAKARIAMRIDRAAFGNLGDHKRFEGLVEMRIDYGPGYRLYAVERANGEIVVLLCGGDKSSQARDIRLARKMAKDVE